MYPQIMPQEQIAPEAPVVYKAVTDQAVDAYDNAVNPQPVAAIKLDPEQFKNRLYQVGEAFQAGGMIPAIERMKTDADLMQAIRDNPDIIQKIVRNPNPKNETPAGVGVNAVAKAVGLSESVTNMAGQLGVNLNSGEKIPPQLQGSFMDGIRQVFRDSQIKPGSMEAVAQRDYFTALLTGKGIGGAMEAYGARYNQLADESRKFNNDVALESAKKQLEFQMKNQERIALTKSTTDGIGKVLAGQGSNMSVQTIQQVQQQASNILANAQKEPAAAAGAARALIQEMSEMGVPEGQLTKVAKYLNDVVKLDPDKAKEYAELEKTGLANSGALTRFRFGIATEADNKKINAAIIELQAKKSAAEAKAEADKQTAVALAKSQAALTPVEVPGRPGVFMTQQAIDAQGKVIEQEALIPGKVTEANALIPTKVSEQKALMPGVVRQAGQVAGAQEAAQMPFKQQMEVFKTGQQKEMETFKTGQQKEMEVFKTGQEGQRVFNREAAQEVVKNLVASPELQSSLNKYQKAIKVIDEGKVNIGPALSLQPMGQWITKNYPNPTEASQNTKDVQTAIDSIVQKMAKDLGANPSDADLKFLMANKPAVDKDSPARIRDWLDIAAKKISLGSETTTALGTAAGIANMPRPVGGSVEQPTVPQATKVVDGVTYVYDGKGWKKR